MSSRRFILTLSMMALIALGGQSLGMIGRLNARQPTGDDVARVTPEGAEGDESIVPEAGEQPPEADPAGNPGTGFSRGRGEERKIRELRRRVQRFIDMRRWREAIKATSNELLVLDGFNPNYHLTLGLLFRELHDREQARRKYQDFMDLGGNMAVGHLLIADALASGPRMHKGKVFEHLRKSAENGMNLMKAVDSFDSLKKLMGDTEFIKLALRLEQYHIDFDSNIKDPMTNRFRKAQMTDDELGRMREPMLTQDQQRMLLQEAHRLIQRIELALNTRDEDKAMAAYGDLVELSERGHKISDPQLRSNFRGIMAKREEIEARIEEIRLKYLYAKAQGVIEDMAQSFKNEDYPNVQNLNAEVRGLADEMLRINHDFSEVSNTIIEVADEWSRKARIRREFNSKTLRIRGIVRKRDEHFAIVNDRLLKVGETLEDLRVIKIERNRVLFRYKGENVPLVFRRY